MQAEEKVIFRQGGEEEQQLRCKISENGSCSQGWQLRFNYLFSLFNILTKTASPGHGSRRMRPADVGVSSMGALALFWSIVSLWTAGRLPSHSTLRDHFNSSCTSGCPGETAETISSEKKNLRHRFCRTLKDVKTIIHTNSSWTK